MKNTYFKVNILTVKTLVFSSFLITVLGIIFKFQDYNTPLLLKDISIVIAFSAWIIVLNDMLSNRIYNKKFWIISIFILPTITPLFYTIQRDKLIRIETKINSKL